MNNGNNDYQATMTKAAYESLLRVCREALPLEACGVLARSAGSSAIDIVISIRNIHSEPSDSFAFDPEEWTKAYYGMQTNRQYLVGLFHSHPHSAPVPSLRDSSGFIPASGVTYWVVSLQQPSALVQPYRRLKDRFEPIPLVLA